MPVETYPPPPPAIQQNHAIALTALSMGSGLLSAGAPKLVSLAMPHAGHVVPASHLFGMQRLSDAVPDGASAHWIDLLAILFLVAGAVSLFLTLFPRFCKQRTVTSQGERPANLPRPWLLAVSFVAAIVALVPAFANFTSPSWILVMVSLLAVVADYMWVVLHVCSAAEGIAAASESR